MLGDLLDFWCTWNSSSSYLLEPFERSSSSFFCGLVMCGDFNEIAKAHEKFGGYIRPHQQIHIFREAIDQCGFVDLGCVGWKFTWYKNYLMLQFGNAWIGLQEQMCVSSFLASKATALKCWSSNHKPIVIYPLGIPERRFKQAWLEDESCHDSIKLAWRTNNSGSPMA